MFPALGIEVGVRFIVELPILFKKKTQKKSLKFSIIYYILFDNYIFRYPGVKAFRLSVETVCLGGALEGVELSSCIISPRISSSFDFASF